MAAKKPENMTREDLERELLVMLASLIWEDISDECPDPDAIRCFAVGVPGKREVLYVLTEYPDEDRKYALVACPKDRKKPGLITDEKFKLEWLRENLKIASKPDA
jgi:hypothetical protein